MLHKVTAEKTRQKDQEEIQETIKGFIAKGGMLLRQISASDKEAAKLFNPPRTTAQADPRLEQILDPSTAFNSTRLDSEVPEDDGVIKKLIPKTCGGMIKNDLRYVFRYCVINKATHNVMKSILNKRRRTPESND